MSSFRLRPLVASLAAVVVIAGCGGASGTSADTAVADTVIADAVAPDAEGPDALDPIAHVVILHTSDEHGWVSGQVDDDGVAMGGVALMKGAWNRSEPDNALVLSSGDAVVGAAISTWFDGVPAVTAMNALGYDAMALGNHEFDLGREQLAAWRELADFPVLAANVADDQTGLAAFDAPWTLLTTDGITVGVIGLAHPNTPLLTPSGNLDGLTFEAPLPALQEAATAVRAAGAQVVVVLAHTSGATLSALGLDGDADVVFGGHAHAVRSSTIGTALLVESGSFWRGYTRVELTLDRATGEVLTREERWRPLDQTYTPRPSPDATVAAMVVAWEAAVEAALGEEIGVLAADVPERSWAQANWVTDSWRWSFPEAQIAMQNSGGLRAPLAAGPITRADVVDVLPFANLVYEVTMTGAEVADQLGRGVAYCGTVACFVAVSGLTYEVGAEGLDVVLDGGAPLDPDASYVVLVNDFMYFGGAGFAMDGLGLEPWDTGLYYRDPPMAWTAAQGTTAAAPLDGLLDPVRRDLIAD